MSRSINDGRGDSGIIKWYCKNWHRQIRQQSREALHHRNYDDPALTQSHRHEARWYLG